MEPGHLNPTREIILETNKNSNREKLVDNLVFEEPTFETLFLTSLSVHGAANLLALTNLDKYGFSDEQINQILGSPSNWLQ